MHHLIQIWSEWVVTGGYLGIIVLMAMGSTPVPVPAEVVVPPAAFLAAQGRLSLAGVILASTLGAYLGAAVMYWLSRWLGRPLVVRFGRFILFPPKKLEEAEHWLARYEAGGIFFSRLLPGIRHLISIPAGIVRMNFTTFSVMTAITAFALYSTSLCCAVCVAMISNYVVRQTLIFSFMRDGGIENDAFDDERNPFRNNRVILSTRWLTDNLPEGSYQL